MAKQKAWKGESTSPGTKRLVAPDSIFWSSSSSRALQHDRWRFPFRLGRKKHGERLIHRGSDLNTPVWTVCKTPKLSIKDFCNWRLHVPRCNLQRVPLPSSSRTTHNRSTLPFLRERSNFASLVQLAANESQQNQPDNEANHQGYVAWRAQRQENSW